MKNGAPMGLVVAGGLQRLFLSRMPALLEHVGPVKASSFTVARRMVKSLQAGYAVSHYSALETCSLIWIAVPENTLERVVRDLAAQMPIEQTMVVLCDIIRDSSWPNALSAAGARIATVNVVEEGRGGLLLGEGHPETLRVLRRLIAREHTRFLEVLPETKAVYLAGIDMATRLLLPWIDASTICLRSAGLSRSEAMELIESLSGRIAHAYANVGRRVWNRRSAASLGETLEREVEALAAIDPRLGALYAEGVRLSLAHFEPA